MANKEQLNGIALSAVTAGVVFIWAGIRGVSAIGAIESLISGKQPQQTGNESVVAPGGGGSSPSGGGSGTYKNPMRGVHAVWQRIDQGVDLTGTGPIYAVGDGVVKSISGGGWPGGPYILYQLTGGSHSGSYVFIAEQVTPAVSVGDHVTADTVVAHLHGYMETGWGSPTPSTTLAHANGHTAFPTPEGLHFNDFIKSLGAKGGVR